MCHVLPKVKFNDIFLAQKPCLQHSFCKALTAFRLDENYRIWNNTMDETSTSSIQGKHNSQRSFRLDSVDLDLKSFVFPQRWLIQS